MTHLMFLSISTFFFYDMYVSSLIFQLSLDKKRELLSFNNVALEVR